ncbi:MAG TPA: hypothetical protein DIW86_04750 [Pseudomonas sp.]|jgi:hypothetical protein|nr:hypothetical protein [Pseudomonas sp.]
MRVTLAAIVFAFILSGCQTSAQLEPASAIKPNVASEGTLANEKLVSDATAGLQNILGKAAFTSETKIVKSVVRQPEGTPGAQAWQEMWIVDSQGTRTPFLMTFSETGLGSANFMIEKMRQPSAAASANCPKKIGDYKAGEATSEQIKGCLGAPVDENHNPDGRYVYLYEVENNITVGFLFDSSGKLMRTSGYKRN